jgi:Dyp-type peroxidase family
VVAVGVVAPPVAPRGTSVATSHAGADVLDGPLVLRELRPGDPASRMLASLQSNIIHPHVRSHLRLLALRVDDPAAARRGLSEMARGMKSAARQLDELQAHRAARRPGTAFVGVALSATGYARLDVPRAQWPADPAFRDGLRARDLGDPATDSWEAPYREGIDAIVLVGSHDDQLADRELRELRRALGSAVTVLAEETGRTLTNANGDGIEHFGYVDGRSQPLFIDEDLETERRTTDGVSRWNPLVPLSHVLVPDPGADPSDHAYGSYLVYRKLEQNVRAFKQQEARIAHALGLTGSAAERAGALLIGRFEDGTPVTLAETDGMRPVPNDFTYADDEAGARCPFGAHIRRVNPRLADPAARTVIARRGQGYGLRSDDPNDDDLESKPTGGVGLLFMAVVAGVEAQFEALQRAANGDGDGPFDAVLGQRRPASSPPSVELSPRWGVGAMPQPVAVDPVVTLRGGEYCFLPSIDFLRGLGDG